MFEQMKQLKSLMGMLGNPAELREKMERAQAELEELRVEGESGAGAVRVEMNGKFRVLSVRIEPAMMAGLVAGDGDEQRAAEDREMIEELMAAAVNAAMEKAQAAVQAKMAEAAGGIDLSAMSGMLGQG
ncbi:MAG: YbaB/EbfC family nucleoid-associated protein [Planctomycetota bacterium]